MRSAIRSIRFGLAAVVVVSGAAFAGDGADASKAAAVGRPINFSREVRPILSEHCFACHGPDERTRKAKLRLDTKDGVFGISASGERPVVPGKLADSELIVRIRSNDAADEAREVAFERTGCDARAVGGTGGVVVVALGF
jgi:hypothetical protein